MRIKNMRLSVIFKLSLVTAALFGIAIQIGVFSGELRLYVLNYYTLMTNMLCAVNSLQLRTSPFVWLVVPDGYFIYAVIRVALGASIGYGGSRYPYPFIDADTLGWGQVLINGAVLNLLFIVLGFVFVTLDRLLARGSASKTAVSHDKSSPQRAAVNRNEGLRRHGIDETFIQ